MTIDRYGRAVPTTEGTWVKVGKKHYRHIDGAEIKYDCNAWSWNVVGTRQSYKTLSAAQWNVER